MTRSSRANLIVWIAWVAYAHALAFGSVAIFRREGLGTAPVLVGFDPAAPVQANGPGPLTLAVRCNRPAPGLVVEVATDGGEPGKDYQVVSPTLALASDGAPTPLVIEVLDNPNRKATVSLRLRLKAGSGAGVDPARASWVVALPRHIEQPSEGVEVSFTSRRIEVAENAGRATVELRVDPVPKKTVLIPYRVGDRAPGVVEAVPGASTVRLEIDIPDDDRHSGDRTLPVVLRLGPNVRLGDPSRMDVLVHDNEPAPVLTVRAVNETVTEGPGAAITFRASVSSASNQEVTVHCAVVEPSTASAVLASAPPSVIRLSPGERATDVSLPITDDKTPGEDHKLTLRFSDAAGARFDPPVQDLHFTVRDNDAPAGWALFVIVQTTELYFDDVGVVMRHELSDFYDRLKEQRRRDPAQGNLFVGDSYFIVRKGEPAAPWVPGVPLLDQRTSFTQGDRLESIINAAFAEAARLPKPAGAAGKPLVMIFWPMARQISGSQLDPKAIRRPPNVNVALFVLGTPLDKAVPLADVFRGDQTHFLRNRDLFDNGELQKLIDADLSFYDPKNAPK